MMMLKMIKKKRLDEQSNIQKSIKRVSESSLFEMNSVEFLSKRCSHLEHLRKELKLRISIHYARRDNYSTCYGW